MPGVTRAEFELEYAERADVWLGTLTKKAVACACGSRWCKGWKMVRRTEEPDRMGLAYFRGGPMNGQAYRTDDLVTSNARLLPIIEYRWTPSTITSESTGQVARIWLHESLFAEQASQHKEETSSE